MYPNPTKDKISIKSFIAIDKMEIYNVLGNKIHETTFDIIDLSEEAAGIYFLKIYSKSIITTKKVIKI